MDIISYAGYIYKGDTIIGTGFVIDPKNKLLVTATHVIEGFREKDTIDTDDFYFRFFQVQDKLKIKAQLEFRARHREDIILLELFTDTPISLKDPTLISYIKPTSAVWTVGYAEYEKIKAEYKSAQGKLSGYTTKNGIKIYELDIDGIYHGMSGAPVMLEDQGIIGILTTRVVEKDNLTAWVTPIEVVAALDERIQTPRKTYLQNLASALEVTDKILDPGGYVPVRMSVKDSEQTTEDTYASILEAISARKKFTLIGDAGSGKTTALKMAARHLAEKALRDSESIMPVWVNLSEWRGERESFDEFLEKLLGAPSFKSIKNYYPLRSLLDEKRIVLFLDEFDEVQGKNVSELNDWVSRTEIDIYVGCRDTHFLGNWKIDIPVARINSLSTLEAYQFAQNYLKDKSMADQFLSTIAPDGYLDFRTSSHLSQLAANPLFLIMLLADYRRNQWRRVENRIVIPTVWTLFENILQYIWESHRVADALQNHPQLALEYSNVQGVVRKISEIAVQYPGSIAIPRTEVEKRFPQNIVDILNDTKIIKLVPATDTYRFMHSLFADFFAAHLIQPEEVYKYAQKFEWLSALYILSTRSESDRQVVQTSLIGILINQNDDHWLRWGDSILRPLGEIGDQQALGILLAEYEKDTQRKHLLKPMAQIANRLPEDSAAKVKVIDLLKRKMFSPTWMRGDVDLEDIIMTGLEWFMGEYLDATEAIANIKNQEVLDAILLALDKSARHFHEQFASGGLFRQEWFSDYLSSMGEWAIPTLLDALDSDQPDVTTTIANALLKINRPLDVSQIGKVMLSHPVPMVRSYLATTLGKIKDQAAIDFLEKTLDDVQLWSRGTLAIRWRHFLVADDAAESLSYIGGEKSLALLAKYHYLSNGLPSADLLIKRLESGYDVIHRDSLRTQIAYTLVGRGYLDLLLPRLGHINLYNFDGYLSMCPIAEALIQRYEDAHRDSSEGFMVDRLFQYDDPTDKILQFLETTTDRVSKAWALVLIGHIGEGTPAPKRLKDLPDYFAATDSEILSILQKYLLEQGDPYIQDAAAYGLGALIKRAQFSPHRTVELVQDMLNSIAFLSPGNYTGIGLGLSKVAALCNQSLPDYLSVQDLMCASLLEKIEGSSLKESKVALDALETIAILIPDFVNDTVRKVLEHSPTYFFKQANQEYLQSENSQAYPGIRKNVNYDAALSSYWMAIRENAPSAQISWKSRYSKNDWEELGYRQDRLFHQMGKIHVFNENWESAAETLKRSFEEAINLVDNAPDKLFFAVYASSELGNLFHRFLDNNQEALDYYKIAFSLGKQASLQQIADANLSSVFCNATLNFQKLCVMMRENHKVIEIGRESYNLLSGIQNLPDDDLAMIFLNTSTSFIMLRNFEEANHYAELAREKLLRSANRQLKIGALLRIAELQHVFGLSERSESYILEALASAKRYHDEPMEALAQVALAHALNKDKEPQRVITAYLRALDIFGEEQHEKVLQEKAGIYHELAVIYQDLGRYAEAERAFNKAITLVKQVDPEFPNMPYVIQAEYAKFLHVTGRHAEALDLLMRLSQEMMSIGMNIGVVGEILAEIDTREGNHVPDTAAQQWAEALVYAAANPVYRSEFVQQMHQMAERFKQANWHNEEIYAQSLLDLLENPKEQKISPSNPYYIYYAWVRTQL